jgi:hypothetical protein
LPNLLVQVRVILSFKERERTVTSADWQCSCIWCLFFFVPLKSFTYNAITSGTYHFLVVIILNLQYQEVYRHTVTVPFDTGLQFIFYPKAAFDTVTYHHISLLLLQIAKVWPMNCILLSHLNQ